MHSSTVALREDVPARGRRLKAILPNGQVKSLLNSGEVMALAAADDADVAARAFDGNASAICKLDAAPNMAEDLFAISLMNPRLLLPESSSAISSCKSVEVENSRCCVDKG